MTSVLGNDAVLQSIQQAAFHYGISSEGAVGQQILLLGDAFYGYRFTARHFTAVWSASDQTLKVFDLDGRCLGNSLLSFPVDQLLEGQATLRFAEETQRRAA